MSPSKLQFILAAVLVAAAFIMLNVTVAAKNDALSTGDDS
jgi:hypothetical protein